MSVPTTGPNGANGSTSLQARLTALAGGMRGMVGTTALGVAYLVLGITTVQFFLANNVARRMDIVVSGGAIGLGLLVLAGVVLVAERVWLAAHVEAEADRALAAVLVDVAARRDADARSIVALPEHVTASAVSFHRTDCFLLGGQSDLTEMTLEAAQRRTLSACRVCLRELS